MATADFDTIADAIAARFAASALTAPIGYATIRSSTADAPNQIGPTPAVVVFLDQGMYQTGNTTRTGAVSWFVRFYLDQVSDLERSQPALRKWATVLRDQLKGSVQLAGIVDRAIIDSFRLATLTYAGVEYAGIELIVSTVTSEGWVATS